MLHNISIGYTIAWENNIVLMACIKKGKDPSALDRLGLMYLFLNFPNIKHITSLYNRSKAYLAGRKMNHGKGVIHALLKCIDDMYIFSPAPVLRLVHDSGPF